MNVVALPSSGQPAKQRAGAGVDPLSGLISLKKGCPSATFEHVALLTRGSSYRRPKLPLATVHTDGKAGDLLAPVVLKLKYAPGTPPRPPTWVKPVLLGPTPRVKEFAFLTSSQGLLLPLVLGPHLQTN